MAERQILVLDHPQSPWFEYLEDFLEGMQTRFEKFHQSADAGAWLNRRPCDLAFVNAGLLSLALTQKLKVLRETNAGFRIFELGKGPNMLPFDDHFENVPAMPEFQKRLVDRLALPERISVLVVDDEVEIGTMIREFLERRMNPSFQVDYAENGAKGLESIRARKPDVLVLDVKMPVKNGIEVYREVKQMNLNLPAIVFFDAVSGEETTELYKIGRPVIVEKGARQSAMPEMMTLIKKMAYFG